MTSDTTTPAAPALSAAVRNVLRGHPQAAPLADQPVRWLAASSTRIDTGSWLGPSPLTSAVVADRFVLVAAGPKPFVRVVPAAALCRAVYNHVTGELTFPSGAASAPAAEIAPGVRGLQLDSLAARSLVELAGSIH